MSSMLDVRLTPQLLYQTTDNGLREGKVTRTCSYTAGHVSLATGVTPLNKLLRYASSLYMCAYVWYVGKIENALNLLVSYRRSSSAKGSSSRHRDYWSEIRGPARQSDRGPLVTA